MIDRSMTTRVAVAGLVGVAVFQAALAAGAPWGRISWGGGNEGVLPIQLRIASGVAAVGYLVLTKAAITGPRTVVRQRILQVAGVVLGLGAVPNLLSPSLGERVLWTPVAVVLGIALWRLAGERSPARTVSASPVV